MSTPRIEYRIFTSEVRAAKDGKSQIRGYAAVFNTPTDLGYVREQITPGAFKNAIDTKQDVKCLFNHDPNKVLGRTKNGTLRLKEDNTGLHYECDIDKDTSVGNDVHAHIDRGDVDQCSFGFVVRDEEMNYDGDKPLRTIKQADLFDVSPVTYPAYPTTSVEARSNALALKKFFKRDDEDDDPEGTEEQPTADPVADGDFHEAMGLHHVDESSMHAEQATRCRSLAAGTDDDDLANHLRSSARMHDEHSDRCMDMADLHFEKASDCRDMGGDEAERAAKAGKKTKRVAGEDLTAGDFLYVGDPDKPATWSLPWKFSTDAKTKSHLRNALARFDQDEVIPASAKAAVHAKLVAKCKEYGIDVTETKSAGLDIETAKRRTYVAFLSL